MLSIDATRILLGAVLLAFGRKLFWLFVGAVGFVIGMRVSEQYFAGRSADDAVVFSIIVGVVFAAMGLAIRKVAVGAAGFLAGGYFLMQFVTVGHGTFPIGGAEQIPAPLWFVVGGIVGAILMNFLFNWTLIILSAIGGAALICETLAANRQWVQNLTTTFSGAKPPGDPPPVDPHLVSILFTVLASVGILVQAGVLRRRRTLLAQQPSPPPPP